MAIISTCAKLFSGFDASCDSPVRQYFQQAVLINKSDIETLTITKTDTQTSPPTCQYFVEFSLKVDTTGYVFQGSEAGSNFFGSFDKTRSDLGFPQYVHNVQVLATGISEQIKCIVDSLDKGSFIAALQLKDGTVEIYGAENGLSTGDYSNNIQEGGGGAPILLSSLENSPENNLPLVYKSASPGGEGADFDSAFSNPS